MNQFEKTNKRIMIYLKVQFILALALLIGLIINKVFFSPF